MIKTTSICRHNYHGITSRHSINRHVLFNINKSTLTRRCTDILPRQDVILKCPLPSSQRHDDISYVVTCTKCRHVDFSVTRHTTKCTMSSYKMSTCYGKTMQGDLNMSFCSDNMSARRLI